MFCGTLREEYRNASTQIRNFPCSDLFMVFYYDWPKLYMPHCKIRDRSLLFHMYIP